MRPIVLQDIKAHSVYNFESLAMMHVLKPATRLIALQDAARSRTLEDAMQFGSLNGQPSDKKKDLMY